MAFTILDDLLEWAPGAHFLLGIIVTSLITAWVCHKIFENKTQRILHEAAGRWAANHGLEHQNSLLIEAIPSGWFNILMTAIWPSLLERFFSNLATEKLEKIFQRKIKTDKTKFPWRHLKQVEVEHVTLGLTPPQFQIILAKFDPSSQSLRLEADLKWTTSAFQIVLCPVIQSPILKHLKTRFLLSNLEICGRISAILSLSQDQPGVKSCEISFSEVPRIDMRVTPVGVPLKDIPGIPESLRATIVKILTKGMVQPKKLTIDVRKVYDVQRMKRRGGTGGLLTINLKSASGFFEDSSGSVEVYCECKFGTHTFRTPIRSGCKSVTWDWHCGIKLEDKISTKLEDKIEINLYNSKSLGEPVLIASGSASLADLGLKDTTGYPIKSSIALQSQFKTHNPVMDLTFQICEPAEDNPIAKSKSESNLKSFQKEDETDADLTARSEPVRPRQARQVHTGSCPLLRVDPRRMDPHFVEKAEAIEQALAKLNRNLSVKTAPEARSEMISPRSDTPDPMEVRSDTSMVTTDSSVALADNTPTTEVFSSTGFANLLHVTKFDDVLRRDREVYKQKLGEMQNQVSHLERRLTLEQKRRESESLQLLAEGGRFVLHKHHERVVRYVWYDPRSMTLNWSDQKGAGQIKSQPALHISEIYKGTEFFPKTTLFGVNALKNFVQRKIGVHVKPSGPDEAKCLSILLINNKSLNLEIPAEGNGRSRDAWAESFQSLLTRLTRM